jgi:hypothetical protein
VTDRNAAHVTRPRPAADDTTNAVIADRDIHLEIVALKNGRIYVHVGQDDNGQPLLTHQEATDYIAHIHNLMQAK